MRTCKILILPFFSLALAPLVGCNSLDAVSSAAPATTCVAVTGKVWYKARMALPIDATIIVRLEEHGIADAAAKLIGETKILSDGQQVPIAFSLQPDCAALAAAHMPGFGVRIEDATGALLFISDTSFALAPDGATNRIEVVKVQ